VRTLYPGERRRRDGWIDRILGRYLDFYTLLTEQMHTGTAMIPATPITPLQGCRTDDEGMEEHAPCWTPEGPIGLEKKVLTRETASFPGSSDDRRLVALGWRLPGWKVAKSGGKLGGV